ncbi:hypothetical protein QTP70_013437 [Hemibagrus guttatus]|uniref:Ig-like domain-containing protein n=1 Tax=Hemibagrus guttatus TaxID=175788 RepID=A0AAE0QCS7_9TELE|nr:hypothetical protein QTP70_013437 [Hemibagrus guttatus]
MWPAAREAPGTGPTAPSVSLLLPSHLQLSEESASLLCLLSGYSPQGALVSWTVDGSEVKNGVLTSSEQEISGCYSRSSTLTLSKDLWEKRKQCQSSSHVQKDQCSDIPYWAPCYTAYQCQDQPLGLVLLLTLTKCMEAALAPWGICVINYPDDWLILAQSRKVTARQ